MAEGADLDVGPHEAAQAGGERGLADVPVAGVGDHDHVGAQPVVMFAQQRREGVGADLLLALDEHHHVDRQVVAVRPDRPEVGHDPGLVVGGAAAVEAAVPLGWLERRGVPVGRVVLRLDVVMRVEQHGGRSVGSGLVRDHRGRAALAADDVDLGETLGPEQVGHRVGRAPHLTGARGVGAHRLDADQVLEVGAEGGHQVAHRCAEVVAHDPSLRPPLLGPGSVRRHQVSTAGGTARGRPVRRWRGPVHRPQHRSR